MASKDMEKFFKAEEITEDSIEVIESEEVIEGEIVSSEVAIIDSVNDLVLVKPEEVRKNYDESRDALEKNLEVGTALLDQIKESISDVEPDQKGNNRLYESAGSLMKAITETAKTLASLHQEAGILGDSKVNIDNSHKEIHVSASDMQDMVKMFKKKG